MKEFEIKLREDGSSVARANLFEKEISPGIIKKRPALIILPGGCYLYKSYREGDPVAARFAGKGYQTFVFEYPTYWKKKYISPDEKIEINPDAKYPEQVIDLYKLIKMIRENADEWGIDPNQVYVMGFSAGGHVAASGAIHFENEELLQAAGIDDPAVARPDAAVLCYPMLDAELIRERTAVPKGFELQAAYLIPAVFGEEHPDESRYEEMRLKNFVHKDMPPVFLFHTMEDMVTSPLETMAFATELKKNNVPVELHVFENGVHGMSLCDETTERAPGDQNPDNALWPELADRFLKRKAEKSYAWHF